MSARTKNRGYLLCIAAYAVLAASGCSKSPEDRIYDAYKCGKAAVLLEREADARQATSKIEAEFTELAQTVNPSAYMMELSSKFQEDVPLYRYTAGDQRRLLESIYKSDTCQALYQTSTLNLTGGVGQASTDQVDATAGTLQADGGAADERFGLPTDLTQDDSPADPEAVLGVVRVLAEDRSMGPGDVAQFCEENAKSFADADGVQRCKAVGNAQGIPVPKTREDVFRMAAAMTDVRIRYKFCESSNVGRLYEKNSNDYERCFPESARAEAARIGAFDDDEEWTPVITDPAALKERMLAIASRMSQAERELYCRVPGVVEEPDNALSECLAGLSPGNPSNQPLTDADPGYSDEGH